jgi:hypothetical protein
MNRSIIIFMIGFAIGAAIAFGLNLLPYWRTYHAYGGDGYEIIGFPFVFRRIGGVSGSYVFRTDFLITDVAIALAFAIIAGWGAIKASHVARRSGQGFPIDISTPKKVKATPADELL